MAKLTEKIAHTSISSINSFRNCPRSWWIDKILGKKQPSSVAASFGCQYDELIAYKLGLEPADVRERDKDKPSIRQQVLLDGVEEATDSYLEQPHAALKAVVAQKKIHIAPHVWSLLAEELGLCLEISKPIIGYVDLIVQDGLQRSIIDLKTSARKGMRADWAFQILIYCIAENYSSGAIHLMTKTKTPAFYKYPVIVSDETKAWAMKNYTYWATRMDEALAIGCGENLPANPDYWCGWCGGRDTCPAKNSFIG